MKEIGRNDPCFCGSGKKYKKCCIDKEGINVKEEKIKKQEEKIIEFKTDKSKKHEHEDDGSGLKCKKCGGELKKVEMVEYEEIKHFMEIEREIESIKELMVEDMVVILFNQKFGIEWEKPENKKAYLRKVERIDKKGIKIKGLSKYFDIEKGEMKIASKDSRYLPETTYKIKIIDEEEKGIIKAGITSKENYKLTDIVKKLTEKRKKSE